MNLFKKKSILLSLLLITITTVLTLASCADQTADSGLPKPTPENSLAINSDKKVTEDYTAHQITVNVSSNVGFKFAVKDGDDWITPDSTENSHAKGDSIKIAFNLKENKSIADRSTVLLFATANSKEFTDTVYVIQNSLKHLAINTEKKVIEKPTAHQMIVNLSSSADFKFAVKDGDDWIIPENAAKTHAKGDNVKIAFNLKENKSGADRHAKLLFATADSKDFTDTVYVTQNNLSYLVINSAKKVTENLAAHQMVVNVSSNVDFKFAVKDGADWITSAEKTHAKGDHIKITFNLKANEPVADRQAELLFATVDSKDFTDIVHVTQTGVIRVKTPGTLAQEIKNQGLDYLNIKRLTVAGTLSGTDVLCLRKMAGVDEYNKKTSGKLADLDMSLVNFSPDSFVYMHFDKNYQITSPDTFPPYLFTRSTVLKSIKLPLNTKTIGYGAFFCCYSITTITIPADVAQIQEYAFVQCSYLKDITMYRLDPSKMSFDTYPFEDVNINNACLHVPAESVDKYRADKRYKEAFGTNIIAIK